VLPNDKMSELEGTFIDTLHARPDQSTAQFEASSEALVCVHK